MSDIGKGVDRDIVIQRMKRLLALLESRKGIRHAVIGVASIDGDWRWSDAVGAANTTGAPMHSETPWFLASVTKLHIAAVVLRLSEQGALDLEAPIATWLPPELAGGLHLHDGVDHTAEITVTHLLGHLTGLPDYLDERPKGARSLIEEVVEGPDQAWSPVEAVARARDRLTPHFAPSAPHRSRPRIRYSDTNYQLLVALAENVTGQPMAQLYREILFKPLELQHSWLPGKQPMGTADEPATIWMGDQPLVHRPLAMQSFGDLYSTVDDAIRFGSALFSGKLFHEPATAALMWSHFNRFGLPRGLASLRAPSWPIEYGLGMMRFELSRLLAGGLRIPPLIGHTGSTGSWLWYCPQLNLLTAGTVDQTRAATVPFRQLPRALAGLDT